ncbi:Uma2 family endonuclease [Virgibacillus halodenitrificans]|uniref:Uma2 family endonuclease n=1 Tax=Virgibacillus halodenitrificans TaxID=1482 RepID=UPI0009F9C39B
MRELPDIGRGIPLFYFWYGGRRDKHEKFHKYEQSGVKEYWIVEPQEKLVNVFHLQENNQFGRREVYSEENRVHVAVLEGLVVNLEMVFVE